mmetsp:Transcript_122776/g.244228  ORF Transcript_122776/g.244228 Transcript_122776/m.244228 type:complete len:203 (+) Transcript_122776:1753-2361(+)
MRPVIAWIGSVVVMSLFTLGANHTVRLVLTPADMRPGGLKSISKKSLNRSSRGSSLNWLNFIVNDTFVIRTTCLYLFPTSKSLKAMMLGSAMKAAPPPLPPRSSALALTAAPCCNCSCCCSCLRKHSLDTTGKGCRGGGTLLDFVPSRDLLALSRGFNPSSSAVVGRGGLDFASFTLAARTSRPTFSISSGLAPPRPNALLL